MANSSAPLPGIGVVLTAQVRYHLTLLMRTPRALILAVALPGLMMLSLATARGSSAGGQAVSTAQSIAEVSGLMVFGTLSVAYVTYASGLVAAREEGILRRWRATPLPPWGYFAGRIAGSVVFALCTGAVTLIAGVSVAHLHVTAGMAVSLLVANTLGAFTLATAGTAITPVITSAAGANPVLVFTYIPVLFFSGGVGNLALPHWLTTTMSYMPVQPVIHSVTRALQHQGNGLALITPRDLAVLAAWTAGCMVLSVRFFRWDPHRPGHARRPGADRKKGNQQTADLPLHSRGAFNCRQFSAERYRC
jgi:ABC-2 type transport system permease protein